MIERRALIISVALALTPSGMAVAAVNDTQPPSGSFLTRFCAAHPDDEFCARLAALRRSGEDRTSGQPEAEQASSPDVEGIGVYVVTTNGVIRSEPSTARGRATVIGNVARGQRVTAYRRLNNEGRTWLEVRLQSGQPAYMAESLARAEQ